MEKEKVNFQNSFDFPAITHFDYDKTTSRRAIISGYPDKIWENGY